MGDDRWNPHTAFVFLARSLTDEENIWKWGKQYLKCIAYIPMWPDNLSPPLPPLDEQCLLSTAEHAWMSRAGSFISIFDRELDRKYLNISFLGWNHHDNCPRSGAPLSQFTPPTFISSYDRNKYQIKISNKSKPCYLLKVPDKMLRLLKPSALTVSGKKSSSSWICWDFFFIKTQPGPAGCCNC